MTSFLMMATTNRRVVVIGILLAIIVQMVEGGFKGIQGNFCRYRQPSECCDDRTDSCEVPIRDTYCYCDEFCLQGNRADNDCCPDFFEVCLGHKRNDSIMPALPTIPLAKPFQNYFNDQLPALPCEKNGQKVLSGESHMFNCNECKCQNGEFDCDEDSCMVDEDVISTINQSPKVYGWRASNYMDFWGRKAIDGLSLKTGTFNPEDQSTEMYPIVLKPDPSKIPVSFDARKKVEWGGRLGEVCDQGWCGASWAFSTLGVAQDRLSILARGHERVELSAQNLLSCSQLGQLGCQGGYIDRAWNYMRLSGIVKEECYKYDSGKSGKVPKCIIKRGDLSQLPCQSKDLYRMEPAYRISSKEEDVQWEIMHNGPVQALMTVHSDLFMYKSGVYKHTGLKGKGNLASDSATHSVRIIGWGSSKMLGHPVKYWLVANSWGSNWGEKGYFRIQRGTNECGIESFIIASRAKIANLMYGNIPYRY